MTLKIFTKIISKKNNIRIGKSVDRKIACLPTPNLGGDFLAGKKMTVSGWGKTSDAGRLSKVLRKVDVPGITNGQCKALYGRITESMLCAGDVGNGGIDACRGDSGGNFI